MNAIVEVVESCFTCKKRAVISYACVVIAGVIMGGFLTLVAVLGAALFAMVSHRPDYLFGPGVLF